MKLTAKQERFCQEYLIDLNATQAYKRAGYSAKSETVATVEGHKLYHKQAIQTKIKELQSARAERTGISADKVLQELAIIGFARITDFVKVETRISDEQAVNGNDGGMVDQEYKLVNVFDSDKVPINKMPALASIKQGRNGIEIKMHDKVKALELMAKHLGMFTEQVEHEHKFTTVPIIQIPQPATKA